MSFEVGTPVWAFHNGIWRPAAIATADEGVAGTNLIFVDSSTATVPNEAVEPFDKDNTQRQIDPAIRAEVAAFVELLSLSQSAAAAAENDDSASSSSSVDDETEGQATQPAEDDDDATRQRKLDKKAKKALKKEKKKDKKRDKKEKEKKKDKSEKKSKKDKASASQNDAEEDDDLLGIVASPSKDKKDKKRDKKEKKKEKKSKKEKKEKLRQDAEMSQTQDDSSEEDEESEDDMGLKASDLSDASVRNVSRFRSGGGGRGSSFSSLRVLGSQSGPAIPPSASDLVLQRAEQTSRPTSMNIQGSDRRLLTEPTLDNVASQLKGLSAYYKAEVAKLSMGTISAGTGMTQSQGQVMPISEVDYLRAAERRLTSHRNALRILQFRQAQLILKYRQNIDQDEAEDYRLQITTLGAAIAMEAKYNVLDVFVKADAEAKVASNNSKPATYPGVPNLRPILYHRADEPYEKTGVRHHQFSYIDKICEPASEMHLKAVSTIQTVPSKLQADEIRRRQLDAMMNNNLVDARVSFDLGSALPARLKGSVDGTTTSRPRGSAGLDNLMTSSTPRGEASNVRVMTQWRAFRDFDVDIQKKRNHNHMGEYLTTTRPQDIHPPTYTSRTFDFGAQRLDERAEKRAHHVLSRVMSTQIQGGLSGTGQLSLSALLAGGTSTQLGGATSSTALPASDFVRTLTQGGVSQLNITDFGVSRNLKNKQARLDGGSSGILSQSGINDADVASVYSSLGMESEKSVDFEGSHVGAVGMAPVDFGFDVEDAFKSQMVDPGYPDISEIKDLRHVKSVDLPSVGPASEGIDSQASSWQEAHNERNRPSATAGAGITSTNDQFNDLQQRSPSPNSTSPAGNMIRDVLVSECRSIFNKVKAIITEAKKRGSPDLAVSGGAPSASVVFPLNRLLPLHSCLVTPVQLKAVITTLRDRILKTSEIQAILADFYAKNDSSIEIPVSVLLPQSTQHRIRGSVMSYLARQYGIPSSGLQGMRLQRKSANPQATSSTQPAAAQAPGSRRPRQSTYAYDE